MRWIHIPAIILAFAVACTPGSSPPSGGSSELDREREERAIREMMDRFLEARNNFDAEAVGEFFVEDYDQGNLQAGRLQIRSGAERVEEYRTAFEEGRIVNKLTQDEIHSMRFITPNVAIMDVKHVFVTPEGEPSFRNFATYVLVKREGKWRFAAVRLSPTEEQPTS